MPSLPLSPLRPSSSLRVSPLHTSNPASEPSHMPFPLLSSRSTHLCPGRLPDLPWLGQVPPPTGPVSELNEKPKNKTTGEQMNEREGLHRHSQLTTWIRKQL